MMVYDALNQQTKMASAGGLIQYKDAILAV